MKIREADQSDIEELAYVHVESWRTTYSGLLSNDFLSSLTIDGRIKNWSWTFNNLYKYEITYVLENDNHIIGFINGGQYRGGGSNKCAEIYSIYLLKESQRRGLGKFLFKSLVQYLKQKHYETLKVWVLKGNPSIDFYIYLGAKEIRRRAITIGNEELEEIELEWTNINEIIL